MNVWDCKIGGAGNVPWGGDLPMRQAIAKAYKELTGEEPQFIFSGWGGRLTETEREVVQGRAALTSAKSTEAKS